MIASLLFALAMTLILAVSPAGAESGTEAAAWRCPEEIRKDASGLWDYGVMEDGTAVITGFTIDGKTLTIPDEVDGIPVTMVARAPLEKINYDLIRSVTKIVFPQGLKGLEDQAFASFASLQKVDLPRDMVILGYAVFRDCKGLTAVTIPESVVRIGDEAFSGCEKLAFPTLPSGTEEIGRRAFYNCRKLKKAAIPGAVRKIGDEAFAYSGITLLTMGEGIEEIGANAFLGHNLTEAELPSSLRIVGNAAFHPLANKGLRKVTVNGRKTEFGIGVFGYDDGYTGFYRRLQKGQEKGNAADYDKANPENWLDYYRDPDNFGQATLDIYCHPVSRANEVYQYHVKKTYLKSSESSTVTAPAERVLQAGLYSDDDLVCELVIPEGVEEIADYALAGLGTLNKVTLPSTLRRIGAHAFEKCISLSEVVMKGKTMEEIGEAAFASCSQLKKITIPDGVTAIGDATFEDCTTLGTVNLPREGLLTIGSRAFANCTSLAAIRFGQGLESVGTEAFRGCGIKDVQLPNSVKSIGQKAFYNTQLRSLKLPAALETIPDNLCAYSAKLSKVTMPKELKRIERRAFTLCPLENVTLPEGLESIGEEAFAFDTELAEIQHARKRTASRMRSLKLPNSLKSIGKEAFRANDALGSVTIQKGSQLEEIAEGAFSYCSSLRTIMLPDSVRKIGSNAFLRCISMTAASLGSGITEAGDGAFEYCVKLAAFEAPESLVTIGKDLLNNHGKKLKVTCPEESAFHKYMTENYPGVTVVIPKKK